MDFKVFISYSSLDLEHVELLRRQLSQTPVKLFIAEHSVKPGGELAAEIAAAIAQCDLFVVVWSKNAKDSGWVSQEIGRAAALGKAIVPFVLEQDIPPSGFIDKLKYIRVFEGLEPALEMAQSIAMEAYSAKVRAAEEKKRKDSDALAKLALGALFLWAVTSRE